MKKLLFAALLATIAISGSYAAEFWAIGSNSFNPDYTCNGTQAACNLKYGLPPGTIVSTVPSEIEGTPQPPSTYTQIGNYLYDL